MGLARVIAILSECTSHWTKELMDLEKEKKNYAVFCGCSFFEECDDCACFYEIGKFTLPDGEL